MVFLYILIVGGISCLVYFYHPKTKFARADKLLKQNRFIEAQKLFSQIFLKHPFAVTKYSECFFLQGEVLKNQNKTKEAINYFNKAIESKSLLKPKSDKESYSNIAAQAYYEIATLQFNELPDYYNLETIQSFNENIDYINKTRFKDLKKFKKLTEKHILKIAEIYYKLGLEEEKMQSIISAKNNYSNSINNFKNISKNQTYYNSIARNEICKLKIKEKINKESFHDINKTSYSIKKDFFYRYSIYLIKHNNFSGAEKIINKRLNYESIEIQSLKEICLNEKIKLANFEITNINSQINKLYTKHFSIDEALLLLNSLSKTTKYINEINPKIQKEIENLKPSLFNRILHTYYEKKEFGKAINIITKYKDFYKSPILMKNMGNSCINYLKENKLSYENYKTLISQFLTSSYSDNVMLNSLEETIWDDEYTFSLSDSIGSFYTLHSQLPENVNYEEISESNISIGDSQRYLINQFEYLLNNQNIESGLLKDVQDYYDSEKKSIESLISIIPNEIIFATPYFAKKYNLEAEILTELEDDYNQYDNENALKIGLLYDSDSTYSTFQKYRKARKYSKKILKSINNSNESDLAKYGELKKVLLIRNYASLVEEVTLKFIALFDSKIKNNNGDYVIYFQKILQITQTNNQLESMFSNYISSLCIRKINNEEMSINKGLGLMGHAYYFTPNNTHVCKNFITLIKMNIIETLNPKIKSDGVFSKLVYVINNRSDAFIRNTKVLRDTKNDILNQIPSDSIPLIRREMNEIKLPKVFIDKPSFLLITDVVSYAEEYLKIHSSGSILERLDLLMPNYDSSGLNKAGKTLAKALKYLEFLSN